MMLKSGYSKWSLGQGGKSLLGLYLPVWKWFTYRPVNFKPEDGKAF